MKRISRTILSFLIGVLIGIAQFSASAGTAGFRCDGFVCGHQYFYESQGAISIDFFANNDSAFTRSFTLVFQGPAGNPASTAVPTNDYASPPVNFTGSCINFGCVSVDVPSGFNNIFQVPACTLVDNTNIGGEKVLGVRWQSSFFGTTGNDELTIHILDDDSPVTLTALDPEAYEAGRKRGSFLVTREGDLTYSLTVNFTRSGSATHSTDYTLQANGSAITTSVLIPATSNSVVIEVIPTDDVVAESSETVTLTLTSGFYKPDANKNGGTVTIIDNDPVVTIATADANASESGDSGLFTVTRTADVGFPLTIRYTISGTADNGVDYAYLSNTVVIPAGDVFANVTVAPLYDLLLEGNETVTITLVTNGYAVGAVSNATVTITDYDDGLRKAPVISSAMSPTARYGRFTRGSGIDPGYHSFLIPVDFQQGVPLADTGGNGTNLFPGLSWSTLYHYSATNNSNSIVFQNPIAAFGSRAGGSPLYFQQNYTFGIYAGDPRPPYTNTTVYTNALRVQVYDQTTFSSVASFAITIPNISDTNEWRTFLTNGYAKTVSAYGLTTTLSFNNSAETWGAWSSTSNYFDVAVHVTHKASPTNKYIYLVELAGGTDKGWTVKDGSGNRAWSRLYTLEFEERPEWRSLLLAQPQFFGAPMPPGLPGKSAEEFLTNGLPVTNLVNLANPGTYTNLDQSPELRRHPTLDQFVADMGNDPIALANYVLNEIELTDAIDYNDNGAISETSINLGGVNRGAFGVYLEGQGSPTEQCALLVYLLRKAGYPAVYLFAPHNGLKMTDARLSKLLRTQIHSAVDSLGFQFTTNQLIPVNYPWVGLYLTNESRWVHLFPWLKDTQVEEQLDLYSFMPAPYDNAFKWARAYLYGDTNILSLSPEDDSPLTLYPKFLQKVFRETSPTLSLDDVGVRAWNRRNYHSRWNDFPVPTSLVSSNIPVDSLGSTSITNVFPALTNIFNTVSVEISSVNAPTKKVASGELRMAELHNRRFIAWHNKVATNNHTLTLTLASFRTNFVTTRAFTNALVGTNSIYSLVTNVSLAATNDDLQLTIVHKRHRTVPGTYSSTNFWIPYLGFASPLSITNVRFLRKGDLAAICFDVGRATRKMLDQHAIEIWNMERTGSVGTMDKYQGSIAYLMGMSYFEKVDRFTALACRLHKAQPISRFAGGLAMIRAKRDATDQLPNGEIILVQPALDMVFQETAVVGNQTIHLDSGDGGYGPDDRVFELNNVASSALEHNTLNRFFEKADAVSTARLLQIAQRDTTNIIVLTRYNYVTEGDKVIPGSTNKLKDADPIIWSSITNSFRSAYVSNNVVVFTTPGKISNATRTYRGMGAMIFNPLDYQALIGDGLNGGYLPPLDDDTLASTKLPEANLEVDSQNNAVFSTEPFVNGDSVLSAGAVATFDQPELVADIPSSPKMNETQTQDLDLFRQQSGETSSDRGTQKTHELDIGVMDRGNKNSQDSEWVSDPVNVITGEHYIDAVDLRLEGPMPLDIRRNYGSLNVFDNEFGYGWKLNYMPFLTVSLDSQDVLVQSAEANGSVIAYRRQTNSSGVYLNVWKPTTKDNPRLQNLVGSVGNLFNSTITRLTNSGVVTYTLRAPDGGTRIYTERSFDLGSINRTRPYLDKWQDSRGNFFQFYYGSNAAYADFGKLNRIEASNGNFLGLGYDVYAHIIEAWTGDGRRLIYEYDDFGDLVKVRLPDASEINYQYEHRVYSTNSTRQIFSTHLLVREEKPEGRLLLNDYDRERRVINQYATVGKDLRLVRNASFVYSNSFKLTNSYTNFVTGYTLVMDYQTNTTRYEYTNSLLTITADPLSRTNRQEWYQDNETNAPAYPRSLKRTVDARNLITDYKYDPEGNVTNVTTTGDLTGSGNTSETAAQSFAYNTNRLVTSIVNAVGNRTAYTYTNPISPFLRTSDERYASNGTLITVTLADYYTVTNGNTNTTLRGGYGLLRSETRAAGSGDSATKQWSHDLRGFITNHVQFTGTTDPAVSNAFFYNLRGELVEGLDAAGRKILLSYTARGNVQSREVFDGLGSRLALETFYYNQNGELTWIDGPRSGPEDYVGFDYDGGGRKVQEVHFRSRASTDGSGVEPEEGDALYASTFYEYDPFNNLVKTIDPRGHYTRMSYDAMGQLIERRAYDGTAGTNATPLAREGFAYEAGGLVTRATNALGGVTETLYTTAGKPSFRRNADGSTNGWLYYLDGRPRREIQNNGAYWETTYDDAARSMLRTFYSPAGATLATNFAELDRRGNVIRRVDAGGFASTNFFDGLDRLKVALGPAIVSITPTNVPAPGGPKTNVVQQVITNYFDAAGIATTNVNALGEKTVTIRDALGRTTHTEIFGTNGASIRVTDTVYAADHHRFTVWEGTGTNAIPTQVFTDNDGHSVLTLQYPNYTNSDRVEFVWQGYDATGNRTALRQSSWSNSTFTVWATNGWTYDGLNRVGTETVRDGATTAFSYDPAGNVTNQLLPGNLKWQARFNSAGQMTEEKNVGTDSSTTRLTTYNYYSAGSPFAGLLNTRTDARNVTCTYAYDDWLRLATNTHSGSSGEHSLKTVWLYDTRGLATNITQSFADTNTGPDTVLRFSYNAYGLVTAENILVGGLSLSTSSQGFDSALRRSAVSLSGPASQIGYFFGWRADGLLASATIPTGSSSYSYTDAGLLTARTVGLRSTAVTLRDRAGRPLGLATSITNSAKLTETLAWRPDGLLAQQTQVRVDFTNNQTFAYADWSRRLTEERLNLDGSKTWTNTYVYDAGQSPGPGVLTKAGAPSSNSAQWSGGTDVYLRVANETNTVVTRPALGKVNGPATVSALLDGQPMPVSVVGTQALNWNASLELMPGVHELRASANHPSGLFTAWATNWFTNNLASQTATDTFDAAGYLTQRLWKNPSGTTNRTQTLTWDARGRLFQVSDRLIQWSNTVAVATNGVNWQATYDAFGRLLRTVETPVTNSVAVAAFTQTIDHYYDPEGEFLELGVSENGRVTWKLLGPDTDGVYGGQNGTGGFEAIVPGPELFCPILADAHGNAHALFDQGHSNLVWFASRLTGYGAVPGYRPVPLGQVGANLGAKYAWRNRAMSTVGLVYLGGNWYDPVAGHFMSPDPAGHAGSPSLYSFCHGNPYAFWDSDGRLGKPVAEAEIDTPFGTIGVSSRGRSISVGGMLFYEPEGWRDWVPGGGEDNVVSQVFDEIAARGRSFAGGLALTGAGFIPGVSEGMDVYTVGAPDSSRLDRTLSGASLAVNAWTAGLLPNYAPIRRGLSRIGDAFTGVSHAPHAPIKPKPLHGGGGPPNLGKDLPYDSRDIRNQLEAKYGAENITSTTLPPASAPNVGLAGRSHPVTGIPFDSRGLPIFDNVAAFDTRLSGRQFQAASYAQQMEMATRDLWAAIQRGEVSASSFTRSQLQQIQRGTAKIDDFTWHHHQDLGRMQLVPTQIHSKTAHAGGAAMSQGR